MQNNLRVLAVDPGYGRVGIAVLEKERGKEIVLYSDCITTPPSLSHEKRLLSLGERLQSIIASWGPSVCVLESLFFSKNQKTALLVAEARGVILYEAARVNIPVYEYTPMEIKVAVTGYGKSGKEEVERMVKKLIRIEKEILHDDEYDAIAAGIAYFAIEKKIAG